jgi:hypothetical protein
MDSIKCKTCAKYEPVAFPDTDGKLRPARCGFCGLDVLLRMEYDVCSEHVPLGLSEDLAQEDK